MQLNSKTELILKFWPAISFWRGVGVSRVEGKNIALISSIVFSGETELL